MLTWKLYMHLFKKPGWYPQTIHGYGMLVC